jgi:hypothetical protein
MKNVNTNSTQTVYSFSAMDLIKLNYFLLNPGQDDKVCASHNHARAILAMVVEFRY